MLSCMQVCKDLCKDGEAQLVAFWIQLKLTWDDSLFRSDIY